MGGPAGTLSALGDPSSAGVAASDVWVAQQLVLFCFVAIFLQGHFIMRCFVRSYLFFF